MEFEGYRQLISGGLAVSGVSKLVDGRGSHRSPLWRRYDETEEIENYSQRVFRGGDFHDPTAQAVCHPQLRNEETKRPLPNFTWIQAGFEGKQRPLKVEKLQVASCRAREQTRSLPKRALGMKKAAPKSPY